MSNKNKKGSGVRVAHDFDDFIEDREVILTLKDSNILEGEKIVEDVDTLENVELAAAYKAQVDLENKTKVEILSHKVIFQKSYDYYAEKYKEEKTLLPQYDEKPRYKQGFILDPEVGEYNPEKDKESENKPPKFEHKGTLVSLETTKVPDFLYDLTL
jgi:SART-1 family.